MNLEKLFIIKARKLTAGKYSVVVSTSLDHFGKQELAINSADVKRYNEDPLWFEMTSIFFIKDGDNWPRDVDIIDFEWVNDPLHP